jgi:hypothetical protein
MSIAPAPMPGQAPPVTAPVEENIREQEIVALLRSLDRPTITTRGAPTRPGAGAHARHVARHAAGGRPLLLVEALQFTRRAAASGSNHDPKRQTVRTDKGYLATVRD